MSGGITPKQSSRLSETAGPEVLERHPEGWISTLVRSINLNQKSLKSDDSGPGSEKLADSSTKAPKNLDDYKQIVTTGDSRIRYETKGGKTVEVDRHATPALFETVKQDAAQMTALNQSGEDGYGVLPLDAEPPGKLSDYRFIGPPDEVAKGIIRYEMQNGARVVVAERANPELFAAIKKDYESLIGINKSEADGYERLRGDATPPPYYNTEVGAPGEMGPEVIRYEHDSEKFVVARSDNPELYDYLSEQYATLGGNAEHQSAIDGAVNDGAIIAGADTEAPELNDFKNFSWQTDARDDVIRFTTHDGRDVVVSKALTPDLFKTVSEAHKTWDRIHELEGDGYQLRSADEDIPVLGSGDSVKNATDEHGDVIEGLKLVEVDGEKFIVSKGVTPEHFEAASSFQQTSSESVIDDVFTDHDLPRSEETNLMGQETTVENDDGEAKTVTELYMEKLEEKAENSDNENFKKYARLLELKTQLDNGSFQYLPYMTVNHGGDWTYYASDTQGMDPADLRGLIHEENLGIELAKLLGDEEIAKFTEEAMSEAQSKIKDRDGLADRIYDSLTGDKGTDYLDAVEDLRDKGFGDEAATRLNNDLNTLQALDPERAAEARGSITAASTARGVEGELSDIDAEYESGDISPESEEAAEQVAADMVPTILTSITYGTFGIQTTNGVWNAVNDVLSSGKTDPKGSVPSNLSADEKLQFTKIMAIASGLKEIIKTAAMSGSNMETALKDSSLMRDVMKNVGEQLRNMTTSRDGQPPIVELSDSQRTSMQSSLRTQFQSLMASNTMFAIGGMAALSNAIYRRSGDDFGDTAEERMTVARGMLVFIGTTPFALKGLADAAGSKLDDGSRLAKLFGTTDITHALGLDKEMGDVVHERFPDKFNGGADSSNNTSLMNPGSEARERLNSVNSSLIELETLANDPGASQGQLEQRIDEVIRDANAQLDEVSSLAQGEAGIGSEEQARIQDGIDRLKSDIDSLEAAKSNTSSTNSRETFVTALEDIFYDAQSHLSEFSTNATPNEVLYSQIDDFDRSVGEYRQMLDADGKGKGRMPENAGKLFDAMMEKHQNIRESITNDPSLTDTDRTRQLERLDDMAGRLNDVRPPSDGSRPTGLSDALDDLDSHADDLHQRFDPANGESSKAALQSMNQTLDATADVMTNGERTQGGTSPDRLGGTSDDGDVGSKKKALIGPALKGLAYMTDFAGGILDTVVAGIGLDKLIKNGGTPMEFAASSTGVVSGSFFTIGGAAEIGASLQTASRVLTGLGAGLRAAGPIGNLIGLGVGIASLILNAVMAQKKGAETEGKIRDQFEQFAEDGVTEDDWGEKFNYLINSSYGFKDMMHAGDNDKEPDPLFKEWFPEDMAAWEAQPEQYEKFTQEIRENGNVDDFFFDFDKDQMQLNIHGQEFYQENKEIIDTVLTNWGKGDGGSNWTGLKGGDDIVSRDDLEDISEGKYDSSQSEKDAADFLLENEEFFALLDTLHKQDGSDGKISSADIDSWMQLIGEREITDDNPAFAKEKSIWDNPASFKL
ncbi:hypothetical protein [Kushneria marisflavi]|uniref:Uncharacterized protein n=1 Tax=Kushneria marisflavi TaxID=157779 RepID=A0A240UM55_9GAMM|nr:hypothetical protein [Kushneria marisflavi]ART62100.1 hypothetical protein B9H00_02600 [Kushneria marisflavi]RKD87173.1 hypothetical protein C8D96_0631 [Kushneria marisflavi]